MSTNIVDLGHVPVNRGDYDNSARYYKDNIVQYSDSSFICDPAGWDAVTNPEVYVQGVAPYNTETHQVNAGWRLFANGIDEFSTGERVGDVGIDSAPVAGSENLVQSGGVFKSFENRSVDFDSAPVGTMSPSGVINTGNTTFNTTDYIKVKEGYIFYYKGYTGSSTSQATVCGWDSTKQNVTCLVVGNGSKTKEFSFVIPSGIAYIRVTAANSAHASYDGRFLYRIDLDGIEDFETGESVNNTKIVGNLLTVDKSIPNADIVRKSLSMKADYDGGNYLLNLDGTITTTIYSNFDVTGYIAVTPGSLVHYKGYISSSYACVIGYDANKENPLQILVGDYTTQDVYFQIPSTGVTYIRACGANSTHGSYNGRLLELFSCENMKLWLLDKIMANSDNITALFDDVDEINGTVNDLKEDVDRIHDSLFSPVKNELSLTYKNPAVWAQFTASGARKYYIESSTAPTEIKLYAGFGTTTTLVRTLSGTDITSLGEDVYSFLITAADIIGGANWMRIIGATYSGMEVYYITYADNIDEIDNKLKGPLYGKKIAVIGDSISTINGNNTPYFTIMDIDVGNEIQSYISYVDVYGTDTSENPTPLGTTIGGVTLTANMIGTLQTFTPVAGDVGKMLGQAYNYNAASTKVWSEVLCEKAGATLLANASFSGASMCSGQSGIWTFSHAFSPMTIGRCRVRDEEGNYVNPDVIIIYRGTNDLSHNQGDTGYSRLDEYDFIPASNGNSYPETDTYDDSGTTVYGFRRAYYKTIQALRAAYPGAIIYCCTLNVFKRVYYSSFPTRNNLYTLPQMNDCIRDIANVMGCGVIEFDKDGITFENCYSEGYITDSSDHPTHPNSKGHAVMAKKAFADITNAL